jgi:hypothetical protein
MGLRLSLGLSQVFVAVQKFAISAYLRDGELAESEPDVGYIIPSPNPFPTRERLNYVLLITL